MLQITNLVFKNNNMDKRQINKKKKKWLLYKAHFRHHMLQQAKGKCKNTLIE